MRNAALRAWARTIGWLPSSFWLRLTIFGVLAMVISGIGHFLSHPGRNDSTEAAHMVDSIVAGSAQPAVVPEDFDERDALIAEADELRALAEQLQEEQQAELAPAA